MSEVFSGMRDVRLGYNTDIDFENGDLMITTGIDYLEIEIYKLLITEPGDWKASPLIGCSPNKFIGEENIRDTGKKIEQYIKEGLKVTVYPCNLSVRVVPTNYSTIMIFIDVLFQTTLIDSIPFEFDFISGIKKVTKIDSKVTNYKSSENYSINNITNLKKPNKYVEQIRKERLR